MKFTSEDFHHNPNAICTVATFIDMANDKFKEWLISAPTVYGNPKNGFWGPDQEGGYKEFDTHTAKLVCIEEIKK